MFVRLCCQSFRETLSFFIRFGIREILFQGQIETRSGRMISINQSSLSHSYTYL